MALNQPILQTNPQEQVVQIPTNIESDSTTVMNQTGNSNWKPNYWPTSILSAIFFVVIGQSIAKLLQNFDYDEISRSEHDENRQSYGVWTQALLQTVGFPLLLIPYYIILTTKKHNQQQPLITSDRYLAMLYICSGIIMSVQGGISAMGKLEIPFGVFTLIYTTLLFFTPLFAALSNKIKFNRWTVISLMLAIVTGALTLTSACDEPDKAGENYARDSCAALFAGVCFSLLLCIIQNAFDCYIFKRTESTTKKPSFLAYVFEVIIFSSIVVTIISVVALLIAGEQEDLKREMNGFSKGKGAYVMAMACQAVSWQIYWVGIVGLGFSVSTVLSNVIAVMWPFILVFVMIIFLNLMDEFKGVALITAFLSAVAYFLGLHLDNPNSNVMPN